MQQQLINERITSSITLRNKVDSIRAQDQHIDELLRSITLGRTDGQAKVDGILAGLKDLQALNHQRSLDFLCKTQEGANTTENLNGKSKVHRFELDAQTDLWSKPDPVGMGHIDAATAYLMQALYRVLCSKPICTSVKTVKVKNTQTQFERGCMTSVGVRGISFQTAIFLMHEFKGYVAEFGAQKLAEIIQHSDDEAYMQQLKEQYPSIRANPELDKQISAFKRLFPNGNILENIEKACRLTSYLDPEVVSFMFVIHLLARVNDAKTDNIMLEISHDEHGELVLTPIDIDFDLADGNPLFLFEKVRHIKVPGEEKRKKVTEDHHFTGIKSILFAMTEVLDAPVHQNVKNELTAEHSVFFILDWLELVYQYNLWAKQEIAAGNFTDKDLIEDDKPSMILLAAFRPGMVNELFTDLQTLQQSFAKGDITHRELFQTLHKITAALYEVQEKTYPNPRDALRKIYGGESVEAAITQRDPNHPFTEALQDCVTKGENNDSRKDATATAEISSFVSTFDILSLPTLEEQLLFIEQVGRAFPFIKRLQLDEAQRNELLYQAVKQALPNATSLLISLGADVNQRQRLKKDQQPDARKFHRDQPLLHALLENYDQHDFDSRVLPTLQQLTNCSDLDINLQNTDGDTATMVFTRMVDFGQYKIGKKMTEQNDPAAIRGLNILNELSINGATLIPSNRFGQDAFHIAYNRWAEQGIDEICFALLHKFRGQKLNTNNIEHVSQFVNTYHGDYENDAEVNSVLNGAIHSINEMSFTMSLDKISVAQSAISEEQLQSGQYSDWLKIEGAASGVRYLNPQYAAILLGNDGHIKNDDAYYGRRAINRILTDGNNGIFFKEEPELPGVEYGVFLFRRMLGNHGAAYSELFRFIDKSGKEYAVQLSSRLHGTVLQDDKMSSHAGEQEQESKERLNQKRDEALDTLEKIDPYSFASMFMSSAILNPEDDKPDNFILKMIYNALGDKAYLLSSFDNDHAMVDGYDTKSKKLMVKSIIFCLDQMKGPLDKTFVNEFIHLDVDQFIQEWLTELQARYEQNNSLFKQSNRAFPTPFSQKIVDAIYTKMHNAQAALRDNKQMTAIDLLKILEPQVGVRYEDALYKHNNPYSRFAEITDTLYKKDTKKKSYVTQLGSSDILESQGIPADITVDAKKASEFTPAQALKYHKMLCSRELIKAQVYTEFEQGNTKNFEKIEFESIREYIINNCDFSLFTEKSQSTILKSLTRKPVKFSALVIRNCTKLDDRTFSGILKSCGHLTQINLSGCSNISDNTVRIIDETEQCSTLDHLVLNNTNIHSIKLERLQKVRKIFASNCDRLTSVEVGCQTLKHLVLSNNHALRDLSVNSRRLRTADVRGCSALTDDSISCIVSSSTLENLKIDDGHLRSKKRYLIVQAAKQNQWNAKILKLIIDKGVLDLCAINLTENELIEIAKQAKNKQVPHITTLRLRASNVSARAMRRFVSEHPTCTKIEVNSEVHRDPAQHFKKTVHYDHIKVPFCLESLATGQIARFSASNLMVDDSTLLNQERKLNFKRDDVKAMLQMENSDWLVVTEKEIQLLNGITGKKISTIDIKKSITKRFRSRILGLNKSDAFVEQLSDQFVLLSLTDKKSSNTRLFIANTMTNILRPIKLPIEFQTDCHFSVVNSTEVAMVTSNSLLIFNPHNPKLTSPPIVLTHQARKLRKMDEHHLVAVHDDGLSIIDLQNKLAKPKFVPLGQSCKCKDVVMMPNNYVVVYDDNNAFIHDLRDPVKPMQKIDLPKHNGINNIVVDVYGKLHCSLDMAKGCAIHTVSLTDETVDIAMLRHLMKESNVLPFQNKLCLSASFIADQKVRNSVIKQFEILFDANIKATNIAGRQYLELCANDKCSVKDLHEFILALTPITDTHEETVEKTVDMQGMLIDENDLRYMVRNTSDIFKLINLEPSTLTPTTLRYLLTEHCDLTHINLTSRSSMAGRRTFGRSGRNSGNRNSLRILQIKTPDGREVVIENVPGKTYQALCDMVLSLQGYELDDYIPPIKATLKSPRKPLPSPGGSSDNQQAVVTQRMPKVPPKRAHFRPAAMRRKSVTELDELQVKLAEQSPELPKKMPAKKMLPKLPPKRVSDKQDRVKPKHTPSAPAPSKASPIVAPRRPMKALPVPPGEDAPPIPAKRTQVRNQGFFKGAKPKAGPKAPPRGGWRRPTKQPNQSDDQFLESRESSGNMK